MLNADIKRSIDAARDCLVGQVPDPKGQVEQITTALLYKFMDDRDRHTEADGGNAFYFGGDYAKFSWQTLLANNIGSEERRDLYTAAIAALSQAPHLDDIFRTLFKDAFLSFHDARTLTLFLRHINDLPYNSSEDLGNAYEYLLAIMGTQGHAGQFRTPRHIIDFMVAVLDPQKHERILDPACGTAGFLISAYDHIRAHNKKETPGDLLSPSDRTRLADNLHGYEIDPGMTRLSRVNMFLHNIRPPQIFAYDTLTRDSRWEEDYHVILANPPFMTPRGGINPHQRFAVHANRAEVLFVDYIAEHLMPNGRAGVVVPEGIVLNETNSAYKELRRRLVEEWGLFSVVSLPAGVFNPYSEGVKTSILFLDKKRAKNRDEILFVHVQNDGFDLGTKRLPIKENDLPLALRNIQLWQNGEKPNDKRTFFVDKNKIIQQEGCILGAYIYKLQSNNSSKWPMVSLGEIIEEKKEKAGTEKYPVWSVSNSLGFVENYFNRSVASDDTQNYKIIKHGYFAFNPARINVGSIALNNENKTGIVSPMYSVFKIKNEKNKELNKNYLYFLLKSEQIKKEIVRCAQGGTRQILRLKDLQTFLIPLPPWEVQEEIVAEEKAIAECRCLIDTYEQKIKDKIADVWSTE